MAKDPTKIAQKWASRLAAATEEIRDGVNTLQTAPGVKAASQVDVWIARLNASREKWVARTKAVSLEEWRSKFLAKIGRIAEGASTAQNDFANFMTNLMKYINTNLPTLETEEFRKTGTLERSKLRATKWMEIMANFHK